MSGFITDRWGNMNNVFLFVASAIEFLALAAMMLIQFRIFSQGTDAVSFLTSSSWRRVLPSYYLGTQHREDCD